MKENIISVGENKIKVLTHDDGSVKVDRLVFDNVKEFTLFVNLLTDICEGLMEE